MSLSSKRHLRFGRIGYQCGTRVDIQEWETHIHCRMSRQGRKLQLIKLEQNERAVFWGFATMTLKAGGAFSNGVPLLRHIESTVYQEVYCIDPRGAKIVCGELDDSTSIETFPLAQMVSEFHGASFAEDRILILGAYSSVPSMIANAHNMNHYNLRPFYGCITKSNGFPLLYVGSDRPLENHRHH